MAQTSAFFKKRSFLIVNLLFLALGQALQFIPLSLQTLGFRRRETALPQPQTGPLQSGVAPFQRTLPRVPVPLPLLLRWALCSLGLICGNGSPCPALSPPQLLALARISAEEGWAQ